MQRTTRTATTLAVAALGLVGAGLQVSSPSHAAEPAVDRADAARRGVCEGVRDCNVMGRFDVTGNGRKDRVGLVNHDRDGHIRAGHVTVRVKTARGRLIRQRVSVKHWRGSVWFGKAAINGRPGREIVVGGDRNRYNAGEGPWDRVSFSKGFHVLTFKPGSDLSKARAPGGSKLWWLTSPDGVRSGSGGSDQMYNEWGWWRKKVNGKVRIQKRTYHSGGVAGVWARKTVWVWKRGHWKQRSHGSMGTRGKYGGWHVHGLARW